MKYKNEEYAVFNNVGVDRSNISEMIQSSMRMWGGGNPAMDFLRSFTAIFFHECGMKFIITRVNKK